MLPQSASLCVDLEGFSPFAMRWPSWSSNQSDNEKDDVKWTDTLNATNWSHYKDPRNIAPVIVLTATCLFSAHIYGSYLRRIPQAVSIRPSFWRRRSLFGKVTSVGDGDNFRIFHTPGGRLAGWGWLPWRMVPTKREALKDKTVSRRTNRDFTSSSRLLIFT